MSRADNRDRLEELLDILDDAFHHMDLVNADLNEVPGREEEEFSEIFNAACDLTELLAKKMEYIEDQLSEIRAQEDREIAEDSYNW